MEKRRLGKTNLLVSEIGFGGEWLERHPEEESVELIQYAGEKGVNIIDCWMPDPKSRDIIGKAIADCRGKWYIQGHIGSTWQNGQYVRTREMKYVKPAFEDLLTRLQTDYIDLGMIHYIDAQDEWNAIQDSDYLCYVKELKESGKIHHIGISTHNPRIAKLAAMSGYIEMILFSINPAYDMLPASEDIDTLFKDEYDQELMGINPDRAELYKLCEQNDVGITVMKGFAGGRLFDEKRSPFGVSLSPTQCIHYALTRPAVASILCGYDTKEQVDAAVAYETATAEEKDYASVIANAPFHSYRGECTYCGHCKPCVARLDIAMINKFYDLATMQPEIPATVSSHYHLLEHKASECIGCHACESRCPFGVPIAERMVKTAKLFGCKNRSTLYVSDLDGTLLRSNEVTSEYTNRVINSLTDRGMIFSYATARSLITAKKVTKGINAKIPLIVYNGAFVIDNVTEDILIANYFDESVYKVLDELFANKIYPIVYAYIAGKEKFSFIPELCTVGMNKFIDSRSGDIRTNVVKTTDELKLGDIFYITCIDEPDKLKPLYDKYKNFFHCVYQTDIYTNEQWLEIMPLAASKSNAIKQLQGLLKCEKLIVFGDGKNDIDMFELADESYAVQNAHEDLKKYATAIISSNDEDGVAKWLDRAFN